jgi:hypothetical protein
VIGIGITLRCDEVIAQTLREKIEITSNEVGFIPMCDFGVVCYSEGLFGAPSLPHGARSYDQIF